MNNPKANNVLVETLGTSLRYGGSALADVPALFKDLMKQEAWKDFLPRGRTEPVHPGSFENFVTTPPLDGLGCDLALFRRVIANDTEAVSLFDKVTQHGRGGDHSNVNNINIAPRPEGTSQAQALRRLRQDRPDLHERVLAGELKAHAAMVEAGFRPRTVTIRVSDPASIARTLRKHMSDEDLAELIRILTHAS